MADLKPLEEFSFEETAEGYAIHVTARGGEAVSVEVSPEQLDAIIDALDELLSDDDANFAAGEDDGEIDEVSEDPGEGAGLTA